MDCSEETDSKDLGAISTEPVGDVRAQQLTKLVERSQKLARTIFDVFRAVETQVRDPASYFRTVRKKLGKLKAAAEQFAKDAWRASTHTNFQQAVIASRFLGEQLSEVLEEAESLLPRPIAPPGMTLPRSPGTPRTDNQGRTE